MRIYVNGELSPFQTRAPGQEQLRIDDGLLMIGSRNQKPTNSFKGKIDDVRIYNTALTENQVFFQFGNY